MAHEFIKIAKKIETDIKNGTYSDTLPSIAVLSQMFNVCPATVKRILSILRDKELVSGEHGRCVRVNPKAAGNPYFHKNVVFLTNLFNISTPFYANTIELLTQHLFDRYISVHIFVSENQVHECTFEPDCVLMINNSGQVMLDLLLQKFPECKVIKLNQRSTHFPYVMTNGYIAGYKAIRHLAEDCGHTHIGMLATQLQYPHASFFMRYQGAMDYVKKHPEIKFSMVEVPELELESQTPRKLMAELMAKDPEITAIFASCDVMAMGVYGYAAENNLKIPEDIAVIGVDNQGFGKSVFPKLTTLSENAEATAEKLYFNIRSLLMGKDVELESLTEPYLIINGSTMKQNFPNNRNKEEF